ncbi:hypothetical protein HO173_001744 [Letharia columbiana]|uniref:CHAT domain-containing protein n=1 Tax=Letharia columbiana TaxID=112416 RepID=A0A8H6L8Y5_9LECA|nr:uncharacterized protein HO173_001744 [Letharia columbiana]KAF6240134.1 hypothetical protein HO173_001744 [Letharia columbiana]
MTETDTMRSVINAHFDTCVLREPYTSEVINHLESCTIAHIASHGETDNLAPMKSQLLFRDYGKETLSVQTLSEAHFQRCQLVYLSACETTVNQDAQLLDEGITFLVGSRGLVFRIRYRHGGQYWTTNALM